jgi:hypothetical protein
VYNFAVANPGIQFRGICNGLGIAIGTAEFHLGVLKKAELISFVRGLPGVALVFQYLASLNDSRRRGRAQTFPARTLLRNRSVGQSAAVKRRDTIALNITPGEACRG